MNVIMTMDFLLWTQSVDCSKSPTRDVRQFTGFLRTGAWKRTTGPSEVQTISCCWSVEQGSKPSFNIDLFQQQPASRLQPRIIQFLSLIGYFI